MQSKPPQMLFDTALEDWLSRPESAFDAWLASQGFRPATAIVYRAMWHKWLRWTAERGLGLQAWQAHHIGAFLDESGLEKRHRYRYTRLIERVFHHLQHMQQAIHNPASRAVKERLAEGENDPTTFLSQPEMDRLLSALAVHAPCSISTSTESTVRPAAWKSVRDAALVAIFLGAGLKVSEVRALSLDALSSAFDTVTLRRSDNGRIHQAILLPFAAAALQRWLVLRQTSGTQGSTVFVATPDGRPMHAASIYRRVEHWLEAAKVAPARQERASPQTLRNTYAALLLEQGYAPDEVAGYLGMKDPASGWRLLAAHTQWMQRLSGVTTPSRSE